MLGQVSDEDKIRVYHSVDVFCAPNTGGESFGYRAGRGDGVRRADRGQRPGRVPPGAAGRRAGELFPNRRRGGPGRGGRAAARPARAAGRRCRPPRRRPCATTTGRWWPGTWCGSTRPWCRARARWRWRHERDRRLIPTILVVAAVAIVGVYVSWRAGRLDRLHARLEAARAALDAALVRRSSVALELASSGLLDPATSLLLAGAAHDARSAHSGQELPESDLTRALRAVFGQPGFRASLSGPGWRRGAAHRAGGRGAPGLPGPQVLQRRGRGHPGRPAPSAGPAAAAGRERSAAGVLRDRGLPGRDRRGRPGRRHAPPDRLTEASDAGPAFRASTRLRSQRERRPRPAPTMDVSVQTIERGYPWQSQVPPVPPVRWARQ